MENAKRRIDAMFEMLIKLDIPYYTFHDRDVSPEGSTLEESNKMLDEIVDYLLAKQKETGVKLLWATQNLFSHPRYMNGGSTNPDATTFAYACAQAKKVIEINHKLGGENVVYWGGREGYQSVLNTDVKREMDHMGAFFKMCRDYRNKVRGDGDVLSFSRTLALTSPLLSYSNFLDRFASPPPPPPPLLDRKHRSTPHRAQAP
ncbi:hypothetical protein TL16_g02156 [Triparma laevis f. inornata]|uniref:Xylose isomerase n=1 Tax=Triparma laevis f. inornata TaxID=1714386 RepID=A0A9W6ZLD5_9STRA|nr:hypothetical protein TL16_g02156 [Triparma laevis f. inornata]